MCVCVFLNGGSKRFGVAYGTSISRTAARQSRVYSLNANFFLHKIILTGKYEGGENRMLIASETQI